MAVIQAENVLDFVADTIKDLGKPHFTDISSSLQNHPAAKNLMQKNRAVVESGSGIQFNVLTGVSTAARNVALAESDNLELFDGMQQASTNWRHSQTSYMMIGQLMSMNREPARIVDYVKAERIKAMIALVELMETNFWAAPSASDQKTPLGVPYFCPKGSTKGFNGGNLTGYTSVYGLSNTNFPTYSNWTGPYTSVTRDDFIRGAREMATKTLFRPPVDGIPTPNTGDEFGYYANYAVIQPLEEAAESQNENLGNDVASHDGKVIFRNVPVTYVSWLDRDTTNPMYQFDWGWLKMYILRGWWLRETNIPYMPGQHTVAGHFLDSTYQFVTKNRRCHGIMSTATTYPS